MERYNPPQTSEQSYCYGCARQIRKVQEVMDCLYMEKMHSSIQKTKLEDAIEKLQTQLDLQSRLQSMSLCDKSENSGNSSKAGQVELNQSGTETNNALRDLNEQLIKMITKKSEVPEIHPLEEWKDAIDQKWEERYEKLHKTAVGLANKKEKVEEVAMQQDYTIHRLKREMAELKMKLEEKEEELDELKKKQTEV